MEKTHLLLVEDDTNFGSVLKDFLTFNDYEVTHAVDGEDGWKKFNAGHYDLCILDVMMPKKDGFTLAKEIRAVNKQAINSYCFGIFFHYCVSNMTFSCVV